MKNVKGVRPLLLMMLLILLMITIGEKPSYGQESSDIHQYVLYGEVDEDQLAKIIETGAAIDEIGVDWLKISAAERDLATIESIGNNWVILPVEQEAGFLPNEKSIYQTYLPLLIVDYPSSDDLAGAETYIPGETYWGTNAYIEYIAGDLPIIIGAPHAGYLTPDDIPNRTWGTMGGDKGSQEYTRLVAEHIQEVTCRSPHVIINKLHRSKIDLNRNKTEATQGNPQAELAWEQFHGFIDDAKQQVRQDYERGHYFDFHTHAHASQWVEMGYLLKPNILNLGNDALENNTYKNQSTLRNLAHTSGMSFGQLLRGSQSMGGLLQSRGYKTVPSPAHPGPGEASYFDGGYNISRHGSKHNGKINSTQVETYWKLRTNSRIKGYSVALAETIIDFVEFHYGVQLRQSSCDGFGDDGDEGDDDPGDDLDDGGDDELITGLTVTHDGPAIVGTDITFATKLAQGSNIVYSWDFGDGGSTQGSSPSVSHKYTTSGVFQVTVTASNAVSSQSASTTVSIHNVPPAALFSTSSPDILYKPTRFTDESEGGGLSYSWHFGDGQTSQEANPTHAYASPGTYTVTLTIANKLGTDTYTDPVTVETLPALPTEIRGDWGLDEATGVRQDRSPFANHLGETNGVAAEAGQRYQSALLTRDNEQFLSLSHQTQSGLAMTGDLTLIGWMKPHRVDAPTKVLAAKYQYGQNNRAYRLDVRSEGRRLGFIVSPNGRFTKNYILEATFDEPLETDRWYHVAGVFDAQRRRLTIYLDGDLVATRSVNYDHIYPASAPFFLGANQEGNEVVQYFDGQLDEWRVYAEPLSEAQVEQVMLTSSNAIAGLQIFDDGQTQVGVTKTFTATTFSGLDPQFDWNFGDGTTLTETGSIVTHTYTTSGTFTLAVTASNEFRSQSVTTSIIQDVPAIADFTTSTPDWLGQLTQLTNTSTGSHLTYLWSFGDGITSTLPSPTHTYTSTGTFTVSLTAANSVGADTLSRTVTIQPHPASLQAYWPLDEAAGPRFDLSPQARHLTDHGSVGSTTGLFGGAAQFEDDAYLVLETTDLSHTLTITTDLTLTGWFSLDQRNKWQILAGQYEWGVNNRAYRLGLMNNNRLQFVVSPDGTWHSDQYALTGNTLLETDRWYHVAAVFDARNQTMSLYLDGVLEATQSVNFSQIYPSAAPFILGANLNRGDIDQLFTGRLDEWRLYDQPLSPDLIHSLFLHN